MLRWSWKSTVKTSDYLYSIYVILDNATGSVNQWQCLKGTGSTTDIVESSHISCYHIKSIWLDPEDW